MSNMQNMAYYTQEEELSGVGVEDVNDHSDHPDHSEQAASQTHDPHSQEDVGYRTDKPIRIKAWIYSVYCYELKQRLETDAMNGSLKFVPDHSVFDPKPSKRANTGDNRLASIYNEIYKMLHIREARKPTVEYEEMPDPLTIPRRTKEYKAACRRIADLKKQTNLAIDFVYELTRTSPDNWASVDAPKSFQRKWRSTLLRQDEEWKDVRLTLMAIKANRDSATLAGHYNPQAARGIIPNAMNIPLNPLSTADVANPDLFNVDVNHLPRPKRSRFLDPDDEAAKILLMAIERNEKVIEDVTAVVTNSFTKLHGAIDLATKMNLFTEMLKTGPVDQERANTEAKRFEFFVQNFR